MARLENTTTCLPLAYGSVAFSLGEKADEYHTHRWTLYVRSPDQQFDLSSAISRVVFQLHPSFAQPTRELTEPPFEVTETGWGEFEASIRIHWKELADEKFTVLTHGIRLYPANTQLTQPPTHTNVPVVAEKYDEVVFTNPKADFHKLLVDGTKNNNNNTHSKKSITARHLPYPLSNQPSVMEHFRIYGDEQDVQAMIGARKFLQNELKNVKDRLLRADGELDEIKAALAGIKGDHGGVVLGGGSATAATGAGGGGSTGGVGSSSGGQSGSGGVGNVKSAWTSSKSGGGGGGGGGSSKSKKTKSRSSLGLDSQPAGKKTKVTGQQ